MGLHEFEGARIPSYDVRFSLATLSWQFGKITFSPVSINEFMATGFLCFLSCPSLIPLLKPLIVQKLQAQTTMSNIYKGLIKIHCHRLSACRPASTEASARGTRRWFFKLNDTQAQQRSAEISQALTLQCFDQCFDC